MFGLLNLNKPAGCTSRDLVNRVVRLVGRKVKVGHAGTLDPLATGVLVVCVGPATRLLPLIHEHDKSYDTTFLLGRKSDTDDIEGHVEPVPVPTQLTAEELTSKLPEFTGRIQQVPPIYSAVKVNGKRAYKAARQGEEVQLTAREVTIHRLELTNFFPTEFSLSIDCSSGTYIRSLGRDLALRVGTEAVMSQLVRTRVGPLSLETALDPDSLTRSLLEQKLLSPLVMLDHLPRRTVTPEQAVRLGQGQSLSVIPAECGIAPRTVAILGEAGSLLAIGREENDRLAPQIVLRMKE